MANPKGNPDNLKPVRSQEEAKKKGRKGGIASGKARREKRTQQEIARRLLDMPMEDRQLDDVKFLQGYKGMNITAGEAALLHQLQKAIKDGDGKAYMIVRDTAGEQPVQRMEVNAEIAHAEEEVAALIAKMKAKRGK